MHRRQYFATPYLSGVSVSCFANSRFAAWSTRLPGKSGRYRKPAAMAAGVINELWDFERLYDEVMGAEEHRTAA